MPTATRFRKLPSLAPELVRQEARECLHGAAVEDPTGRSYSEDMFGYFLALERRRFARTRRPFLLLLVELRKRAGVESRFGSRDATRVFDALWDAIRETDFVGWYRDGFVVGAVLTQGLEASVADTVEGVRDRVFDALCERATANIAGRLQLQVHQLPSGVKKELQLWP